MGVSRFGLVHERFVHPDREPRPLDGASHDPLFRGDARMTSGGFGGTWTRAFSILKCTDRTDIALSLFATFRGGVA